MRLAPHRCPPLAPPASVQRQGLNNPPSPYGLFRRPISLPSSPLLASVALSGGGQVYHQPFEIYPSGPTSPAAACYGTPVRTCALPPVLCCRRACMPPTAPQPPCHPLCLSPLVPPRQPPCPPWSPLQRQLNHRRRACFALPPKPVDLSPVCAACSGALQALWPLVTNACEVGGQHGDAACSLTGTALGPTPAVFHPL